MRSIFDCPICPQLPQKSSASSLPSGAMQLVEGPGETRRCPECRTWYYYSYDYDPGEPMVPATETYTLVRLTPVLALERLRRVAEVEQAAARTLLDAQMRDWDAIHVSLAGALAGPLPGLPHVIKHLVESLSDYYLEKNDPSGFRTTLLESRHAAVRADAATDFLYVATEEYQVWTVRAFSRHQQALAAAWLKDDAFQLALLQTLAGCLGDRNRTLILDGVLGYLEREARDTAYFGLMNAFYRHIDATPVVPTLLAFLTGAERSDREIAARLLEDVAKAQPTLKPMIRKALKRSAGELSPQVTRVLKAAGARRRQS